VDASLPASCWHLVEPRLLDNEKRLSGPRSSDWIFAKAVGGDVVYEFAYQLADEANGSKTKESENARDGISGQVDGKRH
jgi:hypothetical protein